MIDIKRALEQYNSLKQEKADNERIINNIEKRIAELEEKGYKEKDSVSGGNGGIQHFSIEGFPYPRYHREKSRLILRKKRWSETEKGYKEKDSVSGGNGGIQHFSIEGFPYPRYHREKSRLILRKKRWSETEEKLDEQISEIEEYLNSIDDSQMRRMIKYKYIEELSWQQVAKCMGGGNTADGCRMAVDRYLKKQYEL